MPCPHGLDIPRNFAIFNEARMWDDIRMGKMRYSGQGPGDGQLKPEQRADKCQECGECLEACPQSIEIPDWMKKVAAELGAP
jgi:predicted aldo/keto reductase-like oxidoreductase